MGRSSIIRRKIWGKSTDERLVLVFNESPEAKTLTLNNHGLKSGQRADLFERAAVVSNASAITLTVPPWDVVAVHVQP